MPLILAGFTWLGSFLATLLASAALWFAQYITRRLVILAAALAAAVVATGVFYVALQGIVDQLSSYTPPWVSLAVQLFLPGNIHLCVTSIAAAHAARLVYVWRYRAIFSKANVSFGG